MYLQAQWLVCRMVHSVRRFTYGFDLNWPLLLSGVGVIVVIAFSRTGDIIEPLLKDQWYVACGDLSRAAIQVSL